MAKRFTDTDICKKQRWYRKLKPTHKLLWNHFTNICNHAGILKIDYGEILEDLGLDDFDMDDFIANCNSDYDKATGKKIVRERIKRIDDTTIWLTGFMKFQYEGKDFMINPAVHAVHSALVMLKGYGILDEGLQKGYFTLSQPFMNGTGRVSEPTRRLKDKDKDKE